MQREYLEHEVRIKERREDREREESRRRDRERERQRQDRHRRGHYSPPPPVRGQYGGRDAHAKRDNDLRELRLVNEKLGFYPLNPARDTLLAYRTIRELAALAISFDT